MTIVTTGLAMTRVATRWKNPSSNGLGSGRRI